MKINTLDGPVGRIVDLYYDIWRFFRRLKTSISNLISWFPIIWKDRDWNHHYLFEMLHFKLKRMEKCIRDGHYVGCEDDADDIKICVGCLERLIEDDYCSEEWEAVHKKWGEMKFIPLEDSYTMTFENIKTEEDEKEYSKDVKNTIEKEEKEISNDLYLLFKVMKDNIRKWWD